MPKVTDKQFNFPQFYINKLDLIAKRVKERKLDAVLIVDGDEGFGKTGMSILSAYYLSQQTGREFNLNNIFFDVEELMNFINSNKKKIIIWDEAALGGLASGWRNKLQQILMQTLMTCRYRQHIIFFNCPKFYRLNQYFITERAVGLIHVYSHNKLDAGRFVYYKHEWLDNMLQFWHSKKVKPYKRFTRVPLRDHFPDAFKYNIINEEEYDNKKDYYTNKIISKYNLSSQDGKLLRLQYLISQVKGISQLELAKQLGLRAATISGWKKNPKKYPTIFKEGEEIRYTPKND